LFKPKDNEDDTNDQAATSYLLLCYHAYIRAKRIFKAQQSSGADLFWWRE